MRPFICKVFLTSLVLSFDLEGYRLIWSDEFNYDGAPDSSKWYHQTVIPDGKSWFNDEIQHYTDRELNSTVLDGLLRITLKKERYSDAGVVKGYTSARLNSKFTFKYGIIEVRAKLPKGEGTWPAIWLLNKNIQEKGAFWETKGYANTSWPECGEIDIMEHWGSNQNYIQSAVHTSTSFGNTVNYGWTINETASENFHIYSLKWKPYKLEFSVDGVVHYSYNPKSENKEVWPFNEPYYIILNIAAQKSIHTEFDSSSMDIDYVRVYQMIE